MDPLSWTGLDAGSIITASLDEELEEYRLLAYLQRVDAQYREHKLYPWLDELQRRIAQLRALAERAGVMDAMQPSELRGRDRGRRELVRRPPPVPAAWAGVERALERALPVLARARERGRELRDELNGHIRMEPVGMVPLDVREGWLLLRQHNQALVYAYSLPIVREMQAPGTHRYIRTRFHATCTVGISSTYGHIKAELVRTGPLPNPATFAFESDITLPRMETFLPLAKRITYEVVAGRPC